MCFRVECRKCGNYSWQGCGKHLASIYDNIEKGKHCLCKPWPGVIIPTDEEKGTDQQPQEATSSASAATTTATPPAGIAES